MDKEEIIRRLKKISEHAVHVTGEQPFIMSLDDGIALDEAVRLLKEQEAVADDIKKAIDYLDWHFEADDGTADKDAQKAWCIIKNKLVE